MSGWADWANVLANVARTGASIYGASQATGAANNAAAAQTQAAQLQANALQNALALQANSTNAQLGLTRDMFQATRDDLAPWRQAGVNALGQFAGQVGTNFQASPGYQFAFGEGQRALDASAAARGSLNSGAHQKALVRYGQGIADQQYGQWMNRLAALSGIGQSATQSGVQANQQYGQAGANALQAGSQAMGGLAGNIGNAQAGGVVGAANAAGQGTQNLLDWWTRQGNQTVKSGMNALGGLF